jgi:hypothetical protein
MHRINLAPILNQKEEIQHILLHINWQDVGIKSTVAVFGIQNFHFINKNSRVEEKSATKHYCGT